MKTCIEFEEFIFQRIQENKIEIKFKCFDRFFQIEFDYRKIIPAPVFDYLAC